MAKTLSLAGDDLKPSPARTHHSSGATRQRGVVPSAELVPMQFRMEPEFVRKFKIAAATNGLKLNELLKECFDCFQQNKK
jgi:predicted HicB family RNase H-like nuclease